MRTFWKHLASFFPGLLQVLLFLLFISFPFPLYFTCLSFFPFPFFPSLSFYFSFSSFLYFPISSFFLPGNVEHPFHQSSWYCATLLFWALKKAQYQEHWQKSWLDGCTNRFLAYNQYNDLCYFVLIGMCRVLLNANRNGETLVQRKNSTQAQNCARDYCKVSL